VKPANQFSISSAVAEFKTLQFNDPLQADKFFEKFGLGNAIQAPHLPYERFCGYQDLLEKLQETDETKFEKMHKGLPYFFMFWTAYDCRIYDKALFYLDAAISEDFHSFPQDWSEKPATKNYLLLNEDPHKSQNRVIQHTNALIQAQLARFNSISNANPISIRDFVEKFVRYLVMDSAKNPPVAKLHRVIVTTLFTFIAEFEERFKELQLRSREGGSIELPLSHLFKGGLIFESLLKATYHAGNCTLGDIFKTPGFRMDFPGGVDTSATCIADILQVVTSNDRQTAFEVTSKLRNTSGHNLIWDDVFDKPENFRTLFEQQINAILYVALKKYL
jgi:hypothetical protein